MNSRRHPSLAVATSVLAVLLLGGCYTSLTTPKEAINYKTPEGEPIPTPDNTATVILAPEYNQAVKDLGIEIAEYRMQPGTRISVEVWGHSISASVNIRPDGRIDLPLIGDVVAEGQTIAELKNDIATRYREYFVDAPQIILNTDAGTDGDNVRGGEVSIHSPTGSAGVVNLTGDEKLSQVLASIRALNADSEWNEIAVIREGRREQQPYIVVCDMERLLRYGDLNQDMLMRNGDIVFVPHEKNTLLEEILATIGVLARHLSDQESVIDYIERMEAY
ncbi:MAG: polysaccharide biosynthesis/export family protein [Planctomycetota bacterium]